MSPETERSLKEQTKALADAITERIRRIQREPRLWQLYCIFVKNGMFAPDALEKAKAFLEHFEENVKLEPTSDDLKLG